MRDNIVGLAIRKQDKEKSSNPYKNLGFLTQLIREALIEGGLGKQDPTAPLKDIIQPGMRVLLKPNWVLHENLSGKGMDCMVTHPNFILTILREVLATRPREVIIGDAPIQRTVFPRLVSDKFRENAYSLAGKCPLTITDFRRDIWINRNGIIRIKSDARDLHNYVQFDLASDSLLEKISDQSPLFRNTVYDPRETTKRHRRGVHQYLICKEALESDVLLNLPKLKTHRKAGITAALKNLVGINGSKAYLPHHRVGGSTLKGDCYPGFAPLKRVAEFFIDQANKNLENNTYNSWLMAGKGAMKLHRLFSSDMELEGGWYGNDTVWRMTMDINRLLLYGKNDGTLDHKPIRKIYSLTDGIIAGEGFGPLEPEPVGLNAVTFSSSSAFADLCHTALIGFDWKKIPLVKGAFENFKYPLTQAGPESIEIHHQGQILTYHEVTRLINYHFKPPRGWIGHIEL